MNELIQHAKLWVELRGDKRAVTALEYGLIAAAVATTIVAAFATFNTSLTGLFTSLGTKMTVR